MARVLHTIIQNLNTGEYRTEDGWTSTISNAKLFSVADTLVEVDTLPTGVYIMIDAYVVN